MEYDPKRTGRVRTQAQSHSALLFLGRPLWLDLLEHLLLLPLLLLKGGHSEHDIRRHDEVLLMRY